jgi:hypothetical protein
MPKLDFQRVSIEVARKIEQVHFQQATLTADGWAEAQIGDSNGGLSAGQDGINDPDSIGRELRIADCQVCRWIAKGAAEFSALDDIPANDVRSPKHLACSGKVSVANGLSDAGAADAVSIKHDRRHGFELESSQLCLLFEKFHITAAIPPEAPVFTDCDGPDGGGRQGVDEIRRFHAGEFLVEMEGDEKPKPQFAHDPGFVVEGFEQGRGSFARGDDTDRVGVESDQSGESALASGGLDGPVDDRLVTDVDPVEDSERQMERKSERGQVLETIANEHGTGISTGVGFFKSYGLPQPQSLLPQPDFFFGRHMRTRKIVRVSATTPAAVRDCQSFIIACFFKIR